MRLSTRGRLAPVVGLARRLAREWRDDRVSGLAAEVAFWATLGIFPGLLALAAATGFLESLAGNDFADRARDEVVEFVSDALGSESSGTVSAVESLFDRPSPGLFTFGLLALVWTASRGFAALIRALDIVYDLEDRRTWLATRVTALVLAAGSVLVAALTLAMLVVGPLLGRGYEVADALGFGRAFATFWTWARLPVAVAVLVAWAATVFHIAPNHQTPWRWDLPGALLTTLLWLLGALGFRVYLGVTATGSNAVFGVLGGALTLMLWLYFVGLAVLVGGELNADLARRRRAEGPPPSRSSRRDRRTGFRQRFGSFWSSWRRRSPGRDERRSRVRPGGSG